MSGAPRLERLTITSEPDQLVGMRSWLWTALVGENMPLDDCAALVLAAGVADTVKRPLTELVAYPSRAEALAAWG